MHHIQPHIITTTYLSCPTSVMNSNSGAYSFKERLLQLQAKSPSVFNITNNATTTDSNNDDNSNNIINGDSDVDADMMEVDDNYSNDASESNATTSRTSTQPLEKRRKNGLLVGKHRLMKKRNDNDNNNEDDEEHDDDENVHKKRIINISVDTNRDDGETEIMNIYEEAKKSSVIDIHTVSVVRSSELNKASSGDDSIKIEKKDLKLLASACNLPHPDKVTNGEDAYFISSCGSSVGIADGVGGWSEHGIDAGEFSREFMNHASDLIASGGIRDPQVVLENAYERIVSVGTSTACIVCFEDDQFRASNIGDSGFLLLRSFEVNSVSPSSSSNSNNNELKKKPKRVWKIVLRSEEQQHYFNCPRQLGTSSFDRPCDAARYTYKAKEGDMVLLGTDGVFDNVSLPTILNYFNMEVSYYRLLKARENGYLDEEMSRIAKGITDIASKASQCKTSMSPFAVNARRNGMIYTGGKLDDITVVVAQLIPSSTDSDDQTSSSLSSNDEIAKTNVNGESLIQNSKENRLLSPNSVCESEQETANTSSTVSSDDKMEGGGSFIDKLLQMRNEGTYAVEKDDIEETYIEIDGSEFSSISCSSEGIIGTIKDTDISLTFEVTEN